MLYSPSVDLKSESEILCCQEEFFRSSFVSSPYWRRTEPPSSQGTPVPAFRSRPSGRESFAPPKVPGPAAARSKCPRRASRGAQRVSKNRIHPRPKEKTNWRARRDSAPLVRTPGKTWLRRLRRAREGLPRRQQSRRSWPRRELPSARSVMRLHLPPSFWCLRKDLGKFERLTS